MEASYLEQMFYLLLMLECGTIGKTAERAPMKTSSRIKNLISRTLTASVVTIMDVWAEANMPELSLTAMIVICVLAAFASFLVAIWYVVGVGISLLFWEVEQSLQNLIYAATALLCTRILTFLVGKLALFGESDD